MDTAKTNNTGSEKLLAFDRKHRLNYEDETAIAVQDGITCIMEDFVQKIGEIEPIFKGKLLTCGSIKSRTKIGRPDEIDFGFHWDLSDSREPMIRDILFVVPNPHKLPFSNHLNDLIITYFYIDKAYQGLNRFSIKDFTPFVEPKYTRAGLNIYHLKDLHKCFTKLIDYIMEDTILPQGWSHGGYNSPEYSGYRGIGASTMFQFIYNDKFMTQPLFISVDFVMLIEMRECYKGDSLNLLEMSTSDTTWLQTFLTKNNCYDKVWLKICQGNSLADHSMAIQKLLQNFDMENPLKIVIRVVKCLSKLAFEYPKTDHLLPERYDERYVPIKTLMDIWRKMCSAQDSKMKFSKVFSTDLYEMPIYAFQSHDICNPEGKRFADIGEHIDCPLHVKSYTMLVLIVSMFCAKAMKHPDLELCDIWKLDDVDSIVTDVLDLLLESVESGEPTSLKDADGGDLLVRLSHVNMYTKEAVLGHVKQMIKVKSEICEN